ncbi:hypothetical protein [Epilithonimonas vandammei]|uniref:hypothetical protein n=1 Tax=Epilithonimonas vandammei TaxID=2487072 RepID=UPI0028AEEAB7|nr:hypothetical protein [Epilithonimonas vandammei]
MNYRISKRTLAKEYLILIITIILIVLSYFILKMFINHEVDKFNKQIAITETGLKTKKEIERINFFNAFNDNFPNNYSYSKFWENLENLAAKDSIKVKWATWNSEVISFNEKMGFATHQQFKNFILSNTFTPKEIVQRDRITSQIIELKADKNSVEGKENFDDKFKRIVIIILFLFYPFRFLVKGLKWSLNNISQKH